MSRFSIASREAVGQVLVLTRQGISLESYARQSVPCAENTSLCRVFPACRHADGTIS
jgi:hypothetical protein